MKYIPAAISSKVGRVLLHTQKHSPTILFAAGVVGVVATVVVASKATLKLTDIVDKTQADLTNVDAVEHSGYGTDDIRKDKAYIYIRSGYDITKLYGPAFALGVASVACLTGSHVVLTRRNAGLIAAYAVVEKTFAEYRERVLEEVGPEKERELRYGTIEREVLSEGKNGEPKVTRVKSADPTKKSQYARFFDEFSQNWNKNPEYNLMFLRAQQNYLNDKLQARGHVFLNEVYDALGLDRTSAGSVVGWVIGKDGDNYIDFGMYDSTDEGARDFVNARSFGAILLDFNVDGVIYDKI